MRLLTEEELDGMVDNSNELKRILSDYLSYWKWFILSVVLCVVGGRIYLHYATPVYRVSTTIMVNAIIASLFPFCLSSLIIMVVLTLYTGVA